MIYPHKFCATNCFCTPLHFTCRVDIWKRISCAFSSTHSQSTNIVPQNKKRARFPWALAPYLHNIFLIYTLFFSPYCTVRYVTLPLLISREQPINTMFPLFSSYLTRGEELWMQWVVRCACVYMDECACVRCLFIYMPLYIYIGLILMIGCLECVMHPMMLYIERDIRDPIYQNQYFPS